MNTDFMFNGRTASDYGVMICYFDGNGGDSTVSGGGLEYIVNKSPRSDKNNYYGAQYNDTLTWEFQICKMLCGTNNDSYFTQDEEREIAKWLVREDGFKWLQFDVEGYEDVYYKAYCSISPYQINGKTVGFTVNITSDSPYGYSGEIIKRGVINSSTPMNIRVMNDNQRYVYPEIVINSSVALDELGLQNTDDVSLGSTKIYNIAANKDVVIDTENRIITGIGTPDDFNYRYIRLKDGINTITTTSVNDVNIRLTYRTIRRVLI